MLAFQVIMKKSGFLPRERSDLVHRHMQSHLRRVEHAKGRVDTKTPRPWLVCTKMKDRAKRERRSTDCDRDMTATGDSTVEPYGQWSTEGRETEHSPGTGSSSSTRVVPYQYLLQQSSGDNVEGCSWHLYHTPTGRLTGFLRERDKLKHRENCLSPEVPWRPPYTSPVHGPEDGMGHSVCPSSTAATTMLCQKSGVPHNIMTGVTMAEYDQQADLDRSTTLDAHRDLAPTRVSASRDESPSTSCKRGRELLLEGANMKQKSHTITERNSKTRQECQDLSLEYCYLQFVSEVTQDILRRRVLTKPALDLLCKTHIDRRKHTLREDEMMKRMDELKVRIGLS